jgi:type II secretory pathway component PulM
MKAWFARFNQREQLSLVALVASLVLFAIFHLVWSPLSTARDSLEVQNQGVAQKLVRVDAMVSEIMQLRASGGAAAGKQNLTSLVNQTTGYRNLAVTRLQPNSRGELQVRFEAVSFDDLMAWVHDMEYREALVVRELSITQAGSSGRVNCTIRLAQGG